MCTKRGLAGPQRRNVLASADGAVGLVRAESTRETARVTNVPVDGLHDHRAGNQIGAVRVHNNYRAKGPFKNWRKALHERSRTSGVEPVNLMDELNERLPVEVQRYWEIDPLFGLAGEGWSLSVTSGWRVFSGTQTIAWDDDSDRGNWLDSFIGQQIVSANSPESGRLSLSLSECRIELWHEPSDYEICVIRFSHLVRVVTAEMLGGPRVDIHESGKDRENSEE